MRGIVVGDVIRRLVARTVQWLEKTVEAATALHQSALSTRAGWECVAHSLQDLPCGHAGRTSECGRSQADVAIRFAVLRGPFSFLAGRRCGSHSHRAASKGTLSCPCLGQQAKRTRRNAGGASVRRVNICSRSMVTSTPKVPPNESVRCTHSSKNICMVVPVHAPIAGKRVESSRSAWFWSASHGRQILTHGCGGHSEFVEAYLEKKVGTADPLGQNPFGGRPASVVAGCFSCIVPQQG